MKRILSVILVLVLLLAGCGAAKQEAVPHWEDQDVVGTGSTSFPLTIADKEGKETHLTICTDEKTVGDALQALEVIHGTEGDYGLYIETVNGLTVLYEEDGCYWAFYVNGEYAQQSADLTPIEPDTEYMLKVEAA